MTLNMYKYSGERKQKDTKVVQITWEHKEQDTKWMCKAPGSMPPYFNSWDKPSKSSK